MAEAPSLLDTSVILPASHQRKFKLGAIENCSRVYVRCVTYLGGWYWGTKMNKQPVAVCTSSES